MNELTLCVKIR